MKDNLPDVRFLTTQLPISHNAITRGLKCSFSVTIQILLNHTILLRLLHYAKYAANKWEINYTRVCIVQGQFEKHPAFRHDCTPTWEPSLALLQTFTINTLNDTPRHHQEWRFPRIRKKFLKNNTNTSPSDTDISGNKTDIQRLKNSLKYFYLRKKK